MKIAFRPTRSVALVAGALLIPAGLLWGQSTKDRLMGLQRDVSLLQAAQQESDRATGERLAGLEALLKQNLAEASKLNQAMAVIERSINKQSDQVVGPVTNTAAKVDALSAQFGGLRDAVEETNSMVTRLQREVDDIKTTLNTLPPPGACTPVGEEGLSGEGGASMGDSFFTQAASDFNRGNYDLAKAQFTDFLQYSSDSARAPEAQYYLGAIAYNQGDFSNAAAQFDLVLERYPVGVISADALFKKGMALHKLDRNADAAREFQAVMDRFPNSSVAPNAEGMLAQMRDGGGKPSPIRQ